MKFRNLLLGATVSSVALGFSQVSIAADTFTEALTEGKASTDIRIRAENVGQDNALEDATALTIRTRLGYTTGSLGGFSAMAEFEDVRAFAVDDYSVPPTGFQAGEYSVIADPEVTELDQGFIQYKSSIFSAKVGRQVITLDNHRFVGHVGWRQDRQTFDAATFNVTPVDDLAISYGYINERRRIFAEEADAPSKDHLINASYKTPAGKVSVYSYMLELDNDTDNALDTFGARFAGASGMFSYAVELASQTSEAGGNEFDATYFAGEFGFTAGPVTIKSGIEQLGSDEGNYGFATPLATLHKFNGWADQFLGTPPSGLNDVYASVGGKAGSGKWAVVLHSFSAVESLPSGEEDLGSELDLVYSSKFGKVYNYGAKAAVYAAGDDAFGKVDTTKAWLWIGASF